jgi:beta-glucanase (GH16 family)
MQPPRRQRGPLAAMVGVALLVLAVTVAVALTESSRLPFVLCGGTATVRLDGSTAFCSFDDEFTGDSLDTRRWQALSTTHVGFHSGFECFVADPSHVDVAGGQLLLTITGSPAGGPCRRFGLPYESGMVTTQGRFAQAYGRFSIRAELPAEPGLQPALWLYPEQLRYGRWPASGEIDIAELFGNTAQTWPHLHYLAAGGYRAHPGRPCDVTPDRFHTYTVDWTPAGFTFRYDGAVCLAVPRWTPAPPMSAPQPFDQPFFVLLELATGSGVNGPGAGTIVPQTMRVDWVRVWGG